MIKFYTRGREHSEHYFESLISFDGKHIDGNNFHTTLPISSKEHRAQRKDDPVYVQFWKGETHSEFVVTDDWCEQHVVLIPNEKATEINNAKANILASDIPSNIKS